MRSLLTLFGIMLTSIVLTSLTIQATDYISNPSASPFSAALGNVGNVLMAGPCQEDMVLVRGARGDFCIDRYEVSVGEDCPVLEPATSYETQTNLQDEACRAISVIGATPWRYVTRSQAALACKREGKRLPTSYEWFEAALGTPDSDRVSDTRHCNIFDPGAPGPLKTGTRDRCVSGSGVYDMIGNVWEWVHETTHDGAIHETELPPAGYVTSVDAQGLPHTTNPGAPDPLYFNDYFWIDAFGVRGVFRGGYWGSKRDAGPYAVNATTPLDFSGNAVGFRCVQ